MVTIGITGPTGCGKTTLLQEIAARGGEIVDCDALYYELLKTDPDLKSALATRVWRYLSSGRQSGQAEARVYGVFQRGQARKAQRDRLLPRWPRRRNIERCRQKRTGTPIFAIDAINLLESGMGALCDVTVCVLAPKEVRMQRIMARDGLTEACGQGQDRRAEAGRFLPRKLPVHTGKHANPRGVPGEAPAAC